jgi:hypothetical protein
MSVQANHSEAQSVKKRWLNYLELAHLEHAMPVKLSKDLYNVKKEH